MTSAGFTIDSKVSDLVLNGEWSWPSTWFQKFPNLNAPPVLNNNEDILLWKTQKGESNSFTVNLIWEELRPRHNTVDWCNLVWFSYCIPKHAFILWLVFRGRLKTQDMIMQWATNQDLDLLCPFCSLQPDSHSHLFFECRVCMQIWDRVNMKAGLQPRPHQWDLLVSRLLPRARRKSMQNVIDKLCLAATVYFIWQERNARLFKKTTRSVDVLAELILSTVRLKMLTFKYRRTSNVERLLAAWDFPVLLISH